MNQHIFRKAVESEFNLNIDVKSRRFDYVVARSCYYFLCRKLLKMSYHEIGLTLDKHHATVIHALKEFEYILADDKTKNGIYNEVVIFSDFLEGIIMIMENLYYYRKVNIPKENT